MHTKDRVSVLIVGGGPVGLTLALGLAHHGCSSTIVESAPDAKRESRTLNLWARTLEIFRSWGVLDDLLRQGTFVCSLDAVNPRTSRYVLSLDLSGLELVSPVAGTLLCPQDLIERTLRDRVFIEPLCQLITGTCTSIEQDLDAVRVTVETEDGRSSVEAEYVVGADGARSTVRRCLGVPLEGATRSQRMVLSDQEVIPSPGDRVRFALDEPGFLVGIRFGEGQWRIMGSVPDGATDEEALAPAAMDQRVRALFGSVRYTTTWSNTFGVHRRVARDYRLGRVLLAGDAAHLISPIGGQGLNAGLDDAENLAWKLAATLSGGDADALLDSYHEERHGTMTTRIAQQVDKGTTAELLLPPWTKKILVRLLRTALSVPQLRDRAAQSISMLNVRYTRSPLLSGNHPLVGTRISDPVLDDGTRLSDALCGRAAIVVTGDLELPGDIGLPVVAVANPPKAWGLHGPTALLLRPDRHVGAVVSPATVDRISDAVDTILGRLPDRSDIATDHLEDGS